MPIDWIQAFILVLAAPFFIFPASRRIWILLIIPFLWISRWLVKREILEVTILNWPIFILTGQVLIFCLKATEISLSLSKVANFLYGVLIYYTLTALLKTGEKIRWGITAFLGGGFFIAIFGLLGIVWINEPFLDKMMLKIIKYLPHVNWMLPGAEKGINQNALAGTILLVLPMGIVLLTAYKRIYIKDNPEAVRIPNFLLLVITSITMLLILLISQTILAWLAFLLSIWLFVMNRKWKLGAVLAFAILWTTLSFVKYDESRNWAQALKTEAIQEKFNLRLVFWQTGIDAIQKHPWLGVGMNRIRLLPQFGYENAHVHNHFLNLAAELGLPALVAYLALLINTGYMCYIIIKKAMFPWMRVAAQGLAAGQLAHVLFGLGDSIPLGGKTGLLFWFSLALITALFNENQKNQIDEALHKTSTILTR